MIVRLRRCVRYHAGIDRGTRPTHRKTKKHESSRKHKKHRTSSGRKSSRKTVKPIPEEIPETPPKQSPVLSGFTPINKSRNKTLSEPSEPYISDDHDPATGPATGPLAAVSTASSARSSASPEALVQMTVIRVSATPPAPASAPQKNVAWKTILPSQDLTRSKSSAVRSTGRSTGPAATGSATGRSTGPAGSNTPSPAPVSAPPKVLAPETPTFKPRRPFRLFSNASPSELIDHPSPVRQRRIRPEPSPIVQETSPNVQEISPSIQETSPSSTAFKMTQASKAKMTLGLLNLPKAYTSIRNSLKAEMQNIGWVNKNTSGLVAFNALCLYLMNLPSLNGFLPIWNGGESDARRALASALQWLIADVGMKYKLSRGQGDRQFKEAAGDSDDDDDGGGQAARRRSRKRKERAVPPELVRPSIMVTVVDPDALGAFFMLVPPPTYDWNDPLNEPSFIGILTKITFPERYNLILKHTAPGRAVRTIWGAIENVPPAAVPPVRPVEVQITDSEELEGWLKNSNSRSRMILAVLHRAGADANLGAEQFPLLNPAFPHVEEDDYSMIDIPAEDSDYEEGKHRINAKGLRVYMPRTDASNQRLIQTLVRRRDRQQDAIDDLDPKYFRKYPLVVGVADPNFLQGTIWTPAGIAAKRAADALAAAGAGGGGGGGGGLGPPPPPGGPTPPPDGGGGGGPAGDGGGIGDGPAGGGGDGGGRDGGDGGGHH
ncbi:hypothetical protein P167DRAFT_550068 [Morchella conica CCBAS932]|uniref:Uncharacterized protein n=1 Tax=Morchella conica CCBAS932 TaxID=1392247 RepID=A0A3N4KMP9_9PEZI|nr:hypothetical protein P167DRAFT_550068 [Morchella conica CCBAS932]